jgi:hypothetical protein
MNREILLRISHLPQDKDPWTSSLIFFDESEGIPSQLNPG